MKKFIVITSIFEPTVAVKAFSQLPDYQLIVVGDKKSPQQWECDGCLYLSVDDQQKLDFQLADVLPFNHYSRKMLGYLLAMQRDAEVLIDTDDDNIPCDRWSFPATEGLFETVSENQGFVNIYQLFTEQKIWPRGLPLQLINTSRDFKSLLNEEPCRVGVWQGLADGDPDVDAIYRLTSDVPCVFNRREPVVLSKGTLCPFNTQNTLIVKELFPLMYLPTYVTFRFTDILRGLVAQPIMWLYGYRLGFTDATVVQERNPHDYMKDFVSELPMYLNTDKVIAVVSGVVSAEQDISTNLRLAYQGLLQAGIVEDRELITLDAWLHDIEAIKRSGC